MKRAIAGSVLVIFLLFLVGSISSSLFSVQYTNTKVEIPRVDIRPTTNAEKTQNAENLEENVDSGITVSEEAKTSQSATSGNYSPLQSETNQRANASSGMVFPDGAIYCGGEPPYAYIPTYNPKEPNIIRIPNVPPELGN